MSHVTSFSPISPETVARIEPQLDHSELCSCIFLLYDNIDTALQHILHEIQVSSRKYQPVLDSALFKEGVVFHKGPLAQWARFCVGKDDNWQDKLLEALLIIKNFLLIKTLGKSKHDLELKFLPSQSNTSCHIDLVRKVLFLMVEDLRIDDWRKLQCLLIKEAKEIGQMEDYNTPECLLLTLMSRNILKTKRGDQKMDFTILRSCLKSMDLYYWAHQLQDIENLINRGYGDTVKSSIDPVQIALSRFDLDPENPGTILIFNLESYDEKLVGHRPLSKREGSEIDCERLRATFNLLKFDVVTHQDPSSKKITNEIATSLKKFCQEAKRSKRERCFAVAILAHGDKDGVFAMDGVLVKWDSILAELRSSDTEGLPRLLLIQACRGVSQVTKSDEKLEVVKDGPTTSPEVQAGNLRDLFELSASVSGFAAYRSKVYGSFFIHSFCKNVLLYGRALDLSQLAPLINRDFDNKDLFHQGKNIFMTSSLSVTASKHLYLSIPESECEKGKLLVRTWDSMNRKQTLPEKQSQEDCQSTYKNVDEKEMETEQQAKEKRDDRERKLKLEREKASEEEFFQELKALALSQKKQ